MMILTCADCGNQKHGSHLKPQQGNHALGMSKCRRKKGTMLWESRNINDVLTESQQNGPISMVFRNFRCFSRKGIMPHDSRFRILGPVMFVVHPTLTVSDRRTREIMATPGGKMMNVCGVTRPFSDANKITNPCQK